MTALEPLVDLERPQVVVVLGDVDSTLAFALVAAKAGALHARGGQPNGDRSAGRLPPRPPADAVDNLRAEGSQPPGLPGWHTMVDSFLARLEGALRSVVSRLGKIAADLPLVLPAHSRAAAKLLRLTPPTDQRALQPLGYSGFLALQAGDSLVFTDSAGCWS